MLSSKWIRAFDENKHTQEIVLTDFSSPLYCAKELTTFICYLRDVLNKCFEAKTIESFYQFKKVYQTYYLISTFKSVATKDVLFGHVGKALDNLWSEGLGSSEAKAYLQGLRKKSQRIDVEAYYRDIFLGKGWYSEQKNKLTEKITQLEKLFLQNAKNSKRFYCFSEKEKVTHLTNFSYATLKQAKARAAKHKARGYVFYFDSGTVRRLLGNIKDRTKRQSIYESFISANKECELLQENEKILNKLLSLKKEFAKLHGHDNYADLVLSSYMLNSAQTEDFLNEAYSQISHILYDAKDELQQLFQADGFMGPLQVWDYPYYHNLFRKNHPKAVSLAQYFSYSTTFERITQEIASLFELEIKFMARKNNLDVFEVKDKKSSKVGLWVVSPFKRAKNEQSPYEVDMCEFTSQTRGYTCAVQFLHLNLAKNGKMSFYDVQTTVHEIGHALHSYFRKEGSSVHGAMGYDLIELPSQFLEQLAFEYDFTKKLATKPLPESLFKKAVQGQKFNHIYYMEETLVNYMAFYEVHYSSKQHSNKLLLKRVVQQRHAIGEFYTPSKESAYFGVMHSREYFGSYVYFFSENIARQLFKDVAKQDFRKLFVLFGGPSKDLTDYLKKCTNLYTVDLYEFFDY